MFSLECDKCGRELQRVKNVEYAICFTCREKARRKRALEFVNKKRIKNKIDKISSLLKLTQKV